MAGRADLRVRIVLCFSAIVAAVGLQVAAPANATISRVDIDPAGSGELYRVGCEYEAEAFYWPPYRIKVYFEVRDVGNKGPWRALQTAEQGDTWATAMWTPQRVGVFQIRARQDGSVKHTELLRVAGRGTVIDNLSDGVCLHVPY
ncbi:hypothetical protein NWF34_15570 [Gordonia sp. GONU]|uniref:hypothetical protein n=1 Tax=Gordonia sp. GONU TaxID=2972949 RepID=UPI0021AD44C3|nr:hypothetical protein [Gordonia sp. GONU]MCR8898365.1 hypothetical protein [Gordonia sp. GONU]